MCGGLLFLTTWNHGPLLTSPLVPTHPPPPPLQELETKEQQAAREASFNLAMKSYREKV